MNWRLLLLASLIGFLANQGHLPAADDGSDTVTTAPSDLYPQVTCTTTDVGINALVLDMAASTRDQLGPLLKLGKTWRFPVNIRVVTPEDPLASKVHDEAVVVTATGDGMTISAILPSTDPDARVFIQRQFVTALLWEKFFATTKSFDTHTQLTVTPVWLVEGLREWLNDDPDHDRESIVKRAVQIHHAPTLVQVTGWKELSDDRLMGLWQRAFCYYLVDSLIQNASRRDNFQQWLDTVSGPSPTSANTLFPTEAGWQRELVDAAGRSRDIVYTWDETVAELGAAQAIVYQVGKESADTRVCTLDTVASMPITKNLLDALNKKSIDLTNLELRAHPSWRPIVALYRFGLASLINDRNPVQAQKYIQQAQQARIAEMAYHQKIVDYINWFVVTKDYAGAPSLFRSYFSTAQELEQAEADPKHPNPIRADLLHVESQL